MKNYFKSKGFITVLASVISIVVGLLIGFILLTLLRPSDIRGR